MINTEQIPYTFLCKASEILADTTNGLTGPEIVGALNGFSIETNVQIPHSKYPFEAYNKRVALLENLNCFPAELQYRILRYLCDHRRFANGESKQIKSLKTELISQFSHLSLDNELSVLNNTLIEETIQWLDIAPNARELYSQAIQKYRHKIFSRNLLDDLRLSLELLLKHILNNKKALEKQQNDLGKIFKNQGRSKEFSNMFFTLVEYYATYQNTYIKHDDAVKEEEIEFIFEISSSFIKHIVQLA